MTPLAAASSRYAPDWWEDRDEIVALLRWLDETGALRDVDEAIYVVEKPWKYSEEREDMVRAQGRVTAI